MENKKEETYKIGVAQKAVIFDEKTNKFLLIKASNPNEYFTKHYGPWELPGGKVETDEKLSLALIREIQEEVGNVTVEIVGPINATRISFDYGPLVIIDYLVKYYDGEIELSDEHCEYRWETAEKIENEKEYSQWLKNIIKKANVHLEAQNSLDGWKRSQADFENYKKRQAQIHKDLMVYANEGLIQEILPVLDNFHASTAHIPEEKKDNAWVTGIMHIQKQLEKVLEDNNVIEIKIKRGDKFDPTVMEAIKSDSNDSNEHSNDSNGCNVKRVLQRGYKIGDRVIRAARVIVE